MAQAVYALFALAWLAVSALVIRRTGWVKGLLTALTVIPALLLFAVGVAGGVLVLLQGTPGVEH